MAVTKEQIWSAADAIAADGKRPTFIAIREAIGGGSYSTIQPAMTEWRARQSVAPRREPAPPFLEQRLGQLAAELWGAAIEAGEARIAAEREALEAARVSMEATRQEAADLADALSGELEQAQSRAAHLAEAASAARNELADAQLKLVAAETRCVELERRISDVVAERDGAQQMAMEAREHAAELGGRLKAAEAQNVLLVGKVSQSR